MSGASNREEAAGAGDTVGVRAVVEILARALTDRPEQVRVVESLHQSTTLIELYVAPGEIGKVIGKQGRTAAALRTLASTAGEREGKTVTLEVPIGMSVSPTWEEMAVVGSIARAHGNRGQVIVNLETDFPDHRFHAGAELFLERGGVAQPLTLTSVRFHRERPVVGIAGVETMNDAEALAGRELRVPVDRLTALPSDTFYRHDLVGCQVEKSDGTRIGRVAEVDGTLTRSRLVVAGPGGEVLIPLVAEICTTIDLPAKRIVIDPPEGLLELNTR